MHPLRRFYIREHLRSSLWFVPAVAVVAAILLAVVLARVDENLDVELGVFRGGAQSAQTLLSTISASMITFTGLVFSITIVVLQLASQQFSPRVLRTFLRDRHSQLALGVFVATFTYSLTVLTEVRTEDAAAGEFVPHISLVAAFALVLLSLAVFVDYIHHISQSIRVGTITRSIGDETRLAIIDIYDHDRLDEPVALPPGDPVQVVAARGPGVLAALDRSRLVELATGCDAVIEVIPAIGDFVPRGAPLMHVYGAACDEEDLVDCAALGLERTMQQDPAFGFRQLVDIAERGLSPAVNDPTTAVQCLDEMHDLLRSLAPRPFPSGQRLDDGGGLRLWFPVVRWEAYVSLAFDEIRHFGAASLQVHRRIRSIIEDLKTVAPPDRHAVLDRQLALMDAAADRHLRDTYDKEAAREPDEQGLGGA